MFIRKSVTKNKKSKKNYVTYKLVESYRNKDGKPRQRVIMSLGNIDLPKRRWPELASLLEARITAQNSFLESDDEIAKLADSILKHNDFVKKKIVQEEENKKSSNVEAIDLNSISTSFSRSLGPELVANKYWDILEFDRILTKCHFSQKQIDISKALILGKLINPGSELATWTWFNKTTSLIEMTKSDLKNVGKDAFYEVGDLLYKNKEKIEKELEKVEQKFFEPEKRVFLYDLTNTYIEGSGKNNDKAKRGRSKEKRSDCPIVTLALMVDKYGFPVFSQIYEGNKGEPQTFKDVLCSLENDLEKYKIGYEKPVLIMDRGIATKDNIGLIDNSYDYTVINRAKDEGKYLYEFEDIKKYIDTKDSNRDSLIPNGWAKVVAKDDVFVKKVVDDENNIAKVLTISVKKSYKEQSMDQLKEKRFLEDIEKLNISITKGNILMPHKVGERIGRIKTKYASCSRFYDIEIELYDNDSNKVKRIKWGKKAKSREKAILNGCYVIESTQKNLTAEEIWKQYMELNHVENAFRD